jgi:hypothetical protein
MAAIVVADLAMRFVPRIPLWADIVEIMFALAGHSVSRSGIQHRSVKVKKEEVKRTGALEPELCSEIGGAQHSPKCNA